MPETSSIKQLDTSKGSLLDVWARADTLAFLTWAPIVRNLQNRQFDKVLYNFHLYEACRVACLAVDLKALIEKETGCEL